MYEEYACSDLAVSPVDLLSWSPDGQRIAVALSVGPGTSTLIVLSTELEPCMDLQASVNSLAWAPCSAVIAYTAKGPGSLAHTLRCATLPGTDSEASRAHVTQITDLQTGLGSHHVELVCWSSTAGAYAGGRDHLLVHSLGLRGPGSHLSMVLASQQPIYKPCLSPSGAHLLFFAVKPGGEHVEHLHDVYREVCILSAEDGAEPEVRAVPDIGSTAEKQVLLLALAWHKSERLFGVLTSRDLFICALTGRIVHRVTLTQRVCEEVCGYNRVCLIFTEHCGMQVQLGNDQNLYFMFHAASPAVGHITHAPARLNTQFGRALVWLCRYGAVTRRAVIFLVFNLGIIIAPVAVVGMLVWALCRELMSKRGHG